MGATQPTNVVAPVTLPEAGEIRASGPTRDVGIQRLRGAGLLRVEIWRDAAVIWVAQHLVLVLATLFGRVVIQSTFQIGHAWTPWLHFWDAQRFATIASQGYGASPDMTAFYPLQPALEHVISPLTGGNTAAAGLLIANLSTLVLFAVLRLWAEHEMGAQVALRTLVIFALFPSSIFLAAAYSEALFLALTAGAFLALRSHCWIMAAVLAALSAVCRPFGVLFVLPAAIEALTFLRREDWHLPRAVLLRVATAVALPVVALASFMGYLKIISGSALAMVSAENSGWQRHLNVPWIAPLTAFRVMLHDPLTVYQVLAALDLGFFLLFIVLLVGVWRRLPLLYGVYCGAIFAIITFVPELHGVHEVMRSDKRFYMTALPVFLVLASWSSTPIRRALIISFSVILLFVYAVLFVNGIWIG